MTRLVILGTIIVNLIIFSLFFLPFKISYDFSSLVHLNVFFNFTTIVFILLGLYFIFKKNKIYHQFFMFLASCSTLFFLLGYVLYHLSSYPVKYTGSYRSFYLVLLLTHILGAFILTPLAQTVLLSAFLKRFQVHKKVARITYPLWLYVSFTGIITYFFLRPYYS